MIGIIRREDLGDGHAAVWVLSEDVIGETYICVWCDHPDGARMVGQQMSATSRANDWPVIGTIPGTPAAAIYAELRPSKGN